MKTKKLASVSIRCKSCRFKTANRPIRILSSDIQIDIQKPSQSVFKNTYF